MKKKRQRSSNSDLFFFFVVCSPTFNRCFANFWVCFATLPLLPHTVMGGGGRILEGTVQHAKVNQNCGKEKKYLGMFCIIPIQDATTAATTKDPQKSHFFNLTSYGTVGVKFENVFDAFRPAVFFLFPSFFSLIKGAQPTTHS